MRIVSRAQTVRPHLLNPGDVFGQILGFDRPALSLPVLMLADTPDLTSAAVQIEAIFSELHLAEAERLSDLVLPVWPVKANRDRVELRVLGTPQLRIREVEFLYFIPIPKHGNAGDDPSRRRVWLQHDARPAVDEGTDADRIGLYEPHVSVDAAEKREVT